MAIPLFAGWALQEPALVWCSLGGWLAMLADPGGPYRARAIAMAALALAGSAATFLGGLAGLSPWLGCGVLFAFALLCSMMRMRGESAGIIGVSSITEFCIAYASPALPGPGLLRATLFAAGAAFALLFALSLWPFRPYHPVRAAVAAVWDSLAEAADLAARLMPFGADAAGWKALDPMYRRVRESLERAREALGVARAAHTAETGRGLQLLVLYEIAELSFGDVEALIESLPAGHHGPLGEDAAGMLLRVAAEARVVA